MKREEIENKLRSMGYCPDGLKFKELIRFIQVLEHNQPCFGHHPHPASDCPHMGCCYRENCANVIPDFEFEICGLKGFRNLTVEGSKSI